MHGSDNNDNGVIASINIIPFVDIVLVLLIIFMVTSTAIVRAAIQVDLPRAASAGESITTTLNLIVTAEGKLLLDGEQMPAADIAAKVREEVSKNKQTQAVISADKRLAYGEVVKVIDLIKQSGVNSFALNIEREVAVN